jgi:hypothetical protein
MPLWRSVSTEVPATPRRLELAALGNGLAVRADDPLRDVEAAAVAFRKPERDEHLVALGGDDRQ